MKKIIKSFLVVLMGFLMSVNVMADVQQEKQNPDYTTDYYMIVKPKLENEKIRYEPGNHNQYVMRSPFTSSKNVCAFGRYSEGIGK